MLLMVFGAEVASGEHQNHRIVSLQLTEPSAHPSVVSQFVVREFSPWHNVGSHRFPHLSALLKAGRTGPLDSGECNTIQRIAFRQERVQRLFGGCRFWFRVRRMIQYWVEVKTMQPIIGIPCFPMVRSDTGRPIYA